MEIMEYRDTEGRWSVRQGDCLGWLRSVPYRNADLVFFSPPYEDARTYGIGFALKGQAWVDWLRPIIAECCRVSAGLVCVNMAAKVKDGRYSAAVEWLVADLTRLDGIVCGPAPHAWVKSEDYDDAPGNGVPGSGAKHYQRRDWEPVYSFCLPGRLPLAWSDNTAFGRPPRYKSGGAFCARKKDGTRSRGAEAGKIGRLGAAGQPKIANPGNVICSDVARVPVGGGKLGCPLAHDGEAPMALGLAERFVRWYCKPGGLVIDPFCGTGTTAHAALLHGRRFAGCDERESQVELTRRRIAIVEKELAHGQVQAPEGTGGPGEEAVEVPQPQSAA